ncbi:MAG: TrbC/VirB2 family protein [Deltaproteobacteria bacterium]
MRRIETYVGLAIMLVLLAAPAIAQEIDTSPIQNMLQSIVDALTGPLGMVIGTLALIGTFLSFFFGIIDLRQMMWVLVAIVCIGAAPLIVSSIWGA